MSFEKKIPDHLKELRERQDYLVRKRNDLVHDCDCNYCDMSGEVTDDNEKLYDDLDKQIKDVGRAIEAVHKHAALHNVEVAAPK